jgi:3',5'-cyclic AMP phosphodiesterase CpdA
MADWSRTIQGVGDLHAGAIRRARVQRMLDDVQTLRTPALHLQIGDATEHGLPEEDEMAIRWLGRLPGPYETILGNHDVMHNKRRVAAWAQAYGYKSQNFAIDLPFVRIIAVGPDRDLPGAQSGLLSKKTLAFLDRALGSASGDCWIACHWPLYRTVLGDPKRYFTSAMQSFWAKPAREIRALLARHRNAKAWLSGHTHSPITVPGFVTRSRLSRERTILAVNFSGLVGTGKVRQPRDPIVSVYLTHLPGTIEVRFRSHRRAAWASPGGRGVVSVRV